MTHNVHLPQSRACGTQVSSSVGRTSEIGCSAGHIVGAQLVGAAAVVGYYCLFQWDRIIWGAC